MSKKFIYFYFMKNDQAKTGQHVPDHINCWKSTELSDYLGGLFADRSCGAITFRVKDIEEATEIASKVLYVREDLLADKWIRNGLRSNYKFCIINHSN